MIKIVISAQRIAEACSVLDYFGLSAGDLDTTIRVAPRFILDKHGEYIVKLEYDDDGDIKSYLNLETALLEFSKVTPKRITDLASAFMEAAASIVNPQSAPASAKRSKAGSGARRGGS